MKKQLLYCAFSLFSISVWSQNILVVDDNNYFPSNTDTLINDLLGTSYTNIDEYDIATEGTNPTYTFMQDYDLVIWYTSTDGANLHLWDEGTTGLFDLNTFLYGEGKLWIIGSDILYGGGYSVPTTFSSGSFAHDKMGIASYDAQSYANDGSTGVAELNPSAGAPAYFTSTISWIYPTSWYVDAITSLNGMVDIYEMGPSNYIFAGKTVMTRNFDPTGNVMSSFFDPFEISDFEARVEFLQASIDYFLDGGLGIETNATTTVQVYPNPASNLLMVEHNSADTKLEIVTLTGQKVLSGSGNAIDISELNAGIYFLKTETGLAKFTKE